MPTITSQPSLTNPPFHPVGNLDSFAYRLQSAGTEFATTVGSNAYFTVEFNGSAQAAGTEYRIFGHLYTVASGTTNNELVDLTSGTAQQHAERFKQAINANVLLYPFVTISLSQSGANWRMYVQWKERIGFPTSPVNLIFSQSAAYLTLVNINPGGTPIYKDFRIDYQLMLTVGVGYSPITSIRGVTPTVLNGSETSIDLNFVEEVAKTVQTTRPFALTNYPSYDNTFKASVFLRYGSHEIVDTETEWGSFTDSSTSNVVNIALKEDETMTPYYFDGTEGNQKFLTKRPRMWSVCKNGQYEWLWFIGDVARFYAIAGVNTLTRYIVQIRRYDIDGNLVAGGLNWPMNTDGIFIIPCGTANLALTTDGIFSYTIQVWADVVIGGTPDTIAVSEVFTFLIDEGCSCPETYNEIYALEPLGGYATFPIHKIESTTIDQTNNTHETTINRFDSAANKQLNNGLSINTPRAHEQLTLQVRARYTSEVYEHIKSLRSTKERFIRYLPDNEFYKFVSDEGSLEIYRQDELVIANMTGRIHLDLPVQKNSIVARIG